MLTKVILDGPLGKQFGKVWELAVNSPSEALRLIDANKPGVFNWIRANLKKYDAYRVLVEYEDGRKEDLDNDSYVLTRKAKSIRFVPVTEGAGNTFKIVVGIILIVVGFVVPGAQGLIGLGAGLLLGGIAGMLAPKPDAVKDRESKNSYYFDGPTNTANQGVPVQLSYGRCLIGSHTISAAVTVDQLM